MPRTSRTSEKARHDPLLVQLKEDEIHAKYGRVSQPGKRKKTGKSSGEELGEVSSFSFANDVLLDAKSVFCRPY